MYEKMIKFWTGKKFFSENEEKKKERVEMNYKFLEENVIKTRFSYELWLCIVLPKKNID